MSWIIRNLARSSLIHAKKSVQLNPIRCVSGGDFYTLVPEDLKDTPETNPFLRNDDILSFNSITPKQVQTGFQALANEFVIEIDNLFYKFETDKKFERTFENLFEPIEKVLTPLNNAYKTARHLAFIYPYSEYHSSFIDIEKKISDLVNERWMNRTFFVLLKELESNKHLMTSYQQRLLEKSMRNCVLNALHFNSAEFEVVQTINRTIKSQQDEFNRRLNYANKIFSFRMNTYNQVEHLPNKILSRISVDKKNPQRGPWFLSASNLEFDSFMQYSPDRNLRKIYYEAFYGRAAYKHEAMETNNAEVIKNLLEARKALAKHYGFSNFAEFVISNKSAVKVDNVINLFDKIKTSLKPVIDNDLSRLNKFAINEGNLIPIENQDVQHWIYRHTKHYYGIDSNKIREYFPLNKVLSGLFTVTNNLFNVKFEKNDSHKDKLWDPRCQVYNVLNENGNHISTLVIDPFIRPRQIDNIWSYSGRSSSQVTSTKPLVYLKLNAQDLGELSTLDFNQVKKLFVEFGRAVEALLNKANYNDLVEYNLQDSDAADLTPKLYRRLLFIPQVAELISGKIKSGEPIPIEILNRLKNGDSNFKIFQLMIQSFLASFDLECHINSEKYWYDIMREFWPQYMPTKLNINDYRPCQFTTIFGEDFGASYYSLIWSEMLSADIFEAFKEVGFENNKLIQDVGKRYKETFLENSGSIRPNELFLQFRARTPSVEPFIKSYLPKPKPTEKPSQ